MSKMHCNAKGAHSLYDMFGETTAKGDKQFCAYIIDVSPFMLVCKSTCEKGRANVNVNAKQHD